jgi:hypothetical protein
VFCGEAGFSASPTQRLDTASPLAITAGVSHAGGKNTGANVAVSGLF